MMTGISRVSLQLIDMGGSGGGGGPAGPTPFLAQYRFFNIGPKFDPVLDPPPPFFSFFYLKHVDLRWTPPFSKIKHMCLPQTSLDARTK